MRVLPFGSAPARTSSGRGCRWKIVSQVPAAPPVVRADEADRGLRARRRCSESLGSNLTSLIEPARRCSAKRRAAVGRVVDADCRRAGAVALAGPFEPIPRVPERVPIRMWLALPGSIATHAIERLLATANEPGTSDQWSPPSVVL